MSVLGDRVGTGVDAVREQRTGQAAGGGVVAQPARQGEQLVAEPGSLAGGF